MMGFSSWYWKEVETLEEELEEALYAKWYGYDEEAYAKLVEVAIKVTEEHGKKIKSSEKDTPIEEVRTTTGDTKEDVQADN